MDLLLELSEVRADALDKAQRRREVAVGEDDVRARRRRGEALGRCGCPEAAHDESAVVASGEAKVAERQRREFKPQDFTNTAWAFAMVKQLHQKLFAVLARAAEQQRRECKPQDFANTV